MTDIYLTISLSTHNEDDTSQNYQRHSELRLVYLIRHDFLNET